MTTYQVLREVWAQFKVFDQENYHIQLETAEEGVCVCLFDELGNCVETRRARSQRELDETIRRMTVIAREHYDEERT